MTLGCPKNRVDSEVMLGSLQHRGYTAGAGARDRRRDRRQHLRVPQGRREGVGRQHPRDGRVQEDRQLQHPGGHRLPGAAARRRAHQGTARGRSLPGHQRLRADRRPARRRGEPAAGHPRSRVHPHGLGAEGELDARVHRVPEDLRGLRQQVRVLHHPHPARPAALAPHRRHRQGGRTSWPTPA